MASFIVRGGKLAMPVSFIAVKKVVGGNEKIGIDRSAAAMDT
ncbi:MAG: hypothetical protein WB870_03635 [Gallionellaceae bacterium]